MSSDKKWTVVGVSGVTCGGKTTFAVALQTAFPSAIIISQDDYFLPPDDPRHTHIPNLNHINWEIASALDMDKMTSDIREILSRPPDRDPPILVIEGFLIFTDHYFSSLCDLKYFFTLPPDVSQARRKARTNHEPRDPSWATAWHDVPEYFPQVVWPEYQRHLQIAKDINFNLIFVDGTRDTQSIVDEASLAILGNLKK